MERLEKFVKFAPELSNHAARLEIMGFFSAPASTKYHGNYEGGLFDHSFAVAQHLNYLTSALHLEWQRPESPHIIGLYHDLCKCDMYEALEDPWENGKAVFEKRSHGDMLLNGHGDKSVMVASMLMQLTEEEVACIRYHMGAFTEKEEWTQYTNAIHKYPNVLWTHTADMLAAHIDMT